MQNNKVFVTIEALDAPVGAMIVRYMKVDKIAGKGVRAIRGESDIPHPDDFGPEYRTEVHVQVCTSPDDISKAVMDAKAQFEKIRQLEKCGTRFDYGSGNGLTSL